jgi:outer membrane lipoprotein-sorting protein
MTTGKQYSRLSMALSLLLILVWPAKTRAQSSIPQEIIEARLNLSQLLNKLVEKNAERADALQSYQSRRYYNLDYTGFPTSLHAEMVVDMIYEAPATKHFKIVSQSGTQWIIDRILKRLLDAEQEALTEENRERVALNSSNYDFSGLERQETRDTCSYVVSVQPKIPSKLLYRGRIWVDSRDFAVCRIEAEPSKNPSFWIKKTDIHHSYLKIGDFWLPSENESVSVIRGGGHAVLTIKYQDYEILAARSLKGIDAGSSSSSLAFPVHAN